jgi:hypothetical protein
VRLATAEWELFLGAWLFSGVYPRLSWVAAAVTFTAFAFVSGFMGWVGVATCGCFGPVPASPWWAFGLDLAALALLCGGFPNQEEPESPLARAAGVWGLAAVATFAVIVELASLAGACGALAGVVALVAMLAAPSVARADDQYDCYLYCSNQPGVPPHPHPLFQACMENCMSGGVQCPNAFDPATGAFVGCKFPGRLCYNNGNPDICVLSMNGSNCTCGY